ncbi:MAG: ATP-binding cassette domain-containing protein [Acutalibacteraceae bacterium]|nr:ATP-binding cassette domain-containing protein [Acutalibacteraceae bacterium]
MEENIIETIGLTKSYGSFNAVDNVSFSIKKGRIYGLIGENGAGKTTLIRLLAGLITKTSGEIRFYGDSDEKFLEKARKKFSFIVETPYYVPSMSAYDNLNLQRIQRGIKDKEVINKALKLVNLEDTGKKQAKNFSLGMRQRLGIAIAMLDDVDVLVLDEPINGLDPHGIIEIRNLILKLNKQYGITVLISSHILSELSQMVTDYIFMAEGKVVKQLSNDELLLECRQSYTLQVSNNEKTKKILTDMDREFIINDNKKFLIFGDIDIKLLSKQLFDNQVYIYELFESTMSLEQYYISLMEEFVNE